MILRAPSSGFRLVRRQQLGLTLVELIIAIAIIGVAVGGILLVYINNARHSADPMQEQQSINIAEAYLDEIEQQSYFALANAAGRSNYNDVCDYNGLSQAPTDQSGSAIGSLSQYSVTVNVSPCPAASSNTPYTPVTIVVAVTSPSGHTVTIRTLRANY